MPDPRKPPAPQKRAGRYTATPYQTLTYLTQSSPAAPKRRNVGNFNRRAAAKPSTPDFSAAPGRGGKGTRRRA